MDSTPSVEIVGMNKPEGDNSPVTKGNEGKNGGNRVRSQIEGYKLGRKNDRTKKWADIVEEEDEKAGAEAVAERDTTVAMAGKDSKSERVVFDQSIARNGKSSTDEFQFGSIIPIKEHIFYQHTILGKIMTLWNLKALPHMVNIGSVYFVITMGCIEDKWKVLLAGPSFIEGHFVSVRLWTPGFDPRVATTEAVAPVCIKIRNLPIEYFNQSILLRIGSALDFFVGTDEPTHNLSAARFARICVILDLAKHLCSSISINGMAFPISFEGSTGCCLSCGNMNHATSLCKRKVISLKGINISEMVPVEPEGGVNNKLPGEGGNWTVVVNRRKKVNQSNKSTDVRFSNSNINLVSGPERGRPVGNGLGLIGKNKAQDGDKFGAKADRDKTSFADKACLINKKDIGTPKKQKEIAGNLESINPSCRLDIGSFTQNLSSSIAASKASSKEKPPNCDTKGFDSAEKPCLVESPFTEEASASADMRSMMDHTPAVIR
ncbi:hypothetical protein G2W53_033301 [Senna tora]|uniref:DUF4283 domain-containing protein n=1 Tax=Senna tora TaxID=362788 RepID=A0A834T0C6_9FABA|nr:hypothetical protein G2W53_033301 [Senna tora]